VTSDRTRTTLEGVARPAGSPGAQSAAAPGVGRGVVGSRGSHQTARSFTYRGLYARLQKHEALIPLQGCDGPPGPVTAPGRALSGSVYPPPVSSVELSRRVEKVVGCRRLTRRARAWRRDSSLRGDELQTALQRLVQPGPLALEKSGWVHTFGMRLRDETVRNLGTDSGLTSEARPHRSGAAGVRIRARSRGWRNQCERYDCGGYGRWLSHAGSLRSSDICRRAGNTRAGAAPRHPRHL
jgi:hypothetical protein